MAANRKKYISRAFIAVLCVFLLVMTVIVILLIRSTGRFQEFRMQHAGSGKIVYEAFRPVIQPPVQTDAQTSSTPSSATPGFCDTLTSASTQFDTIETIVRGRSPSYQTVWMHLFLPAEDFPEEAPSIRCGQALRRKILDEIAMQQSYWATELTLKPPHVDLPTTVSERLDRLVSQVGGLLSRPDLVLPDHIRLSYDRYLGTKAFSNAIRSGRTADASSIFINILRLDLACMISRATGGTTGHINIDDLLFLIAETSEASVGQALSEAASLLARSRLTDEQTKALRVMQVANFYDGVVGGQTPVSIDYSLRKGPRVTWKLDRMARAGFMGMLTPAMQAWADGDEARYYRTCDRLGLLSAVFRLNRGFQHQVYNCFEPINSGFQGEHPYNQEIDRLQLLIAVTRFRRAEGRYPASLGELSRYIDANALVRNDSAWDVARLPTGSYPSAQKGITKQVDDFRNKHGRLPQNGAELDGMKNPFFVELAERPVIYHVRRITVHRDELKAYSFGISNTDHRIDTLIDRFPKDSKTMTILLVEATCFQPEMIEPEFVGRFR